MDAGPYAKQAQPLPTIADEAARKTVGEGEKSLITVGQAMAAYLQELKLFLKDQPASLASQAKQEQMLEGERTRVRARNLFELAAFSAFPDQHENSPGKSAWGALQDALQKTMCLSAVWKRFQKSVAPRQRTRCALTKEQEMWPVLCNHLVR